jgi:hypothetical protein
LEGARQLLDVLQAQERCHFRDRIPGDATWVYPDIQRRTSWLAADAKTAVRVKRVIGV